MKDLQLINFIGKRLQRRNGILLTVNRKVINYSQNNEIKLLTRSIESSLYDYSDAYILVTGNISVERRNAAGTADIALGAITQVAFKNCTPFKKCRTEINETLVDETDFINITMPMYNLIEYSDNYSDTSGSL